MDRRKALQKTGLITGAAIVLPSFLSLLHSCKTETRPDWEPLFFTTDEAVFMSSLVDAILPRTDTPGALDVKADIFMDKVFAKTYGEEARQKVRSEIAQFNDDCRQQFGENFADLNELDKGAILSAKEASSGKFNGSVWGTAIGKQEPVGFYRSIKSMAIWAYFTSEEMGENVLNYDPIPQEYDGCKPLTEVGNRWSL